MQSPAHLSYQEILRTLGGVLDAASSTVAVVHLTQDGAHVTADQPAVAEDWSLDALVAASQQQRQQRATATPWARLLGWQLRLVGAALDLAGPGPYTIMARPEELVVFNAQGYYRAFRHTALERRAALAPEFRGQPTTCPVCHEGESLVPLVHHLPDEEVLGGMSPRTGVHDPTHRCRHCGASVRLTAQSD